MAFNLQAPINSLGFGVCGLNLALALERLGHEPALWPIGNVDAPEEHHAALRRMMARAHSYCGTSPSLRVWHPFALAEHVGRGHHCCYTFFELDRLKPVELHHLKRQDFVFVSSEWARGVLVDNGLPETAAKVAPPGVDRNIFSPDFKDPEPGPTVFLSVGKWEVRKGHDVICEAFNKAFEKDDEVVLVLNCHNPCLRTADEARRYNAAWEKLFWSSKLGCKMSVMGERLPNQRAVAELMRQADCGVFPARAEGWNLEAAEMLAMGRKVILTDYSAHTQFATGENSLLIEVKDLEEAHDGHWFRADDPVWEGRPGKWAKLGEAQVDQLVEHMRSVHRKKQAGELKFNRAGVDSMAPFTWERTARDILLALGGK